MNNVIQVGLVGFGNSARNFHAPLINSLDNFNLKKVVRRSNTPLPEEFDGVELESDLKSLLKDDGIDLIVITTPNHLHFDQARESLSANKHVVVEKPFTVTREEAENLIRLADSQNKKLTVYQNRRWDGDFLTLKDVLEKKLVGEVVEFESTFNRFRNYFKEDAWKEKKLPGSGILYDLSSHLIDQSLQLFGIPEYIYADIRAQRDGDVDDYFEIDLHYPDFKAKLKAGMLVPDDTPRFVLRGKDGSFIKYGLDPQESDLSSGKSITDSDWGKEKSSKWGVLHKWDGQKITRKKIETIAGDYSQFYRRLSRAIIKGDSAPVQPVDAKNVIHLIELAQKSHEQGKRLRVVI